MLCPVTPETRLSASLFWYTCNAWGARSAGAWMEARRSRGAVSCVSVWAVTECDQSAEELQLVSSLVSYLRTYGPNARHRQSIE